MSPEGLDVREYGYGVTDYTVPDGLTHQITTHGAWLLTRIQAFAPAAATGTIDVGLGSITLAAGGCLELLPGGAKKTGVLVAGAGTRVILEWWYQATPDAIAPTVTIT